MDPAGAVARHLHIPTPDDPDPLPPDGTPQPIGDPPNSAPPERLR
jgi:hypothetical protein